MHDQQSGAGRMPTEDVARAVAAVALAAIAVIDIRDLPSTLSATPLTGYGYLVVIAAALLSAFLLVTVPDQRVWILVDLIAFGAILTQVPNRNSGLRANTLDVGQWNRALGITAISMETLIVLLALWRIQQPRLLRSPARSDIDAKDSTFGATVDSTG